MTSPAIDSERLLADSIAGKFPDAQGRFGPFGGRYVPDTLIPALERLEEGIRGHVDGVVVGSALVEVLERGGNPTEWLGALRGSAQSKASAREKG